MRKKKEKKIAWDVIKRQYETGQYSIRALAKLHGITDGAIRKKRDRFNWECKLSAAVKERTRQKLIKQLAGRRKGTLPDGTHQYARDVDPDDDKTPEQIEVEQEETIEAAANRKAEVVTYHQKCLRTMIEAANTLGERCKSYLDDPKRFDEKKLPFRAGRESVADVLNKCAGIQARLLPLERQAYSLDEVTPEDATSSLIEMWHEFKKKRKAEGKRVIGEEENSDE
jgi:transposase-like protein